VKLPAHLLHYRHPRQCRFQRRGGLPKRIEERMTGFFRRDPGLFSCVPGSLGNLASDFLTGAPKFGRFANLLGGSPQMLVRICRSSRSVVVRRRIGECMRGWIAFSGHGGYRYLAA
jgi:hypothetical protein